MSHSRPVSSFNLLGAGSALLLGTIAPPAIMTASAQEASGTVRLEEVVVTSRKREETLLDVPMSISAIGRGQLEELNIKNMNDIAKMSPGLFYTDYGANRADRLYRSYIIRGLAVNNSNNFSDAAILFVDGAPVISGNIPGTLDIERVEILKGPQAAYFGRNTFSGAVSVTTREPRNEWGGSASAEYSSYNSSDVALSVDGPIVKDKLLVRLSGQHQKTGGQYKNSWNLADGLGGQETSSVSLLLKWMPIDNLTVRLNGSFFEYSDEPGAAVRLIGTELNCDPGRTGKNTWWCGEAPRIRPDQIKFNFTLDERYQRLVFPNSFLGNGGVTDHPGLESRNTHLHAAVDYKLPNGWALQSITAYDKTEAGTIADEWFDPTRGNPGSVTNPALRNTWNWLYLVERRFKNESQELRLSSRQDTRLRWTVGGNYVKLAQAGDVIGDVPLGAPLVLPGALGEAKTTAAFGGVYFDILPNLELGAEARQQKDKIRTTPNWTSGRPGNPLEGSFDSFAPRVTLKYKPTSDITLFALASRGVRPGAFNSTLVPGAQPVAVQQQIVALTGASLNVDEEELDDFEVGVKANLLDGRAFVALTAYTGKIKNQQVAQAYTVTTPVVNVGTVLVNRGETKFDGVEFEGEWRLTESFKLGGAFAINNTKITKGEDTSVRPLTGGSTNVIGNRLPNAPRIQGNIEATYSYPVSGEWTAYVSGDYLHIGTKYAETANLAETGAQNLVNARIGMNTDNLRIELWGRNLTNDKTPDLISVAFDYNTFIGNALQVGLPKKRTVGIRAMYKF